MGFHHTMSGLFDGPGAGVVGRIMAIQNADAEAEAVAIMSPAEDATILVLGFGPGVGVACLARRLPRGQVVGIDPSRAMLKLARARNKVAIADGRVRLHLGMAAQTPAAPSTFDGCIAVNTFQLCAPLAATAHELARVLKPGAPFVSLTHDWAAAKHAGTAESWTRQASSALIDAGFHQVVSLAAKAEQGRSIALTARR